HDRREQGLRVARVPVQGVTLPERLHLFLGECIQRVDLGRERVGPLGVLGLGVALLALGGGLDVGGGGCLGGGRRRRCSALHSCAHDRFHVIGGRGGRRAGRRGRTLVADAGERA